MQPRQTPAALLPSVVRHRTLEQLVYNDIRRAIAQGRFAPGQRIVVNSVAAASGVSRIPVMHARRGGFAKESIAEHEEILAALATQDVRKASRAIERHRLRAMHRLEDTR